MKSESILVLIFTLSLSLGALAQGAATAAEKPAEAPKPPAPSEVASSQVPLLDEFHPVIAQLWHEAWPAKNYQMMKDLMPKAKTFVEQLSKVQLKGALGERQGSWDDGVFNMQSAMAAYEKAAKATDKAGLLMSVERLHASFEQLAGTIAPKSAELEAYHEVLYQIFHKHLPNKDADQIRAASAQLVEKCAALMVAPIPERCAGNTDKLQPALKTLCEYTDGLKKTAEEWDPEATERAILRVHSQYQLVASLMD